MEEEEEDHERRHSACRSFFHRMYDSSRRLLLSQKASAFGSQPFGLSDLGYVAQKLEGQESTLQQLGIREGDQVML